MRAVEGLFFLTGVGCERPGGTFCFCRMRHRAAAGDGQRAAKRADPFQ